MTRRPLTRTAASALAGGLLLLGGAAAAPAFAYPPGTSLTISCTPTTVQVGGSVVCTLSNINPAGPNSIKFGGLVAQDAVSFSLAALDTQQAGTYSQTLTAPSTPGKYEVIGTSADETATTTVTVVPVGGGGGSAGGGSTTPNTGANVALGLAAGLGALAIGGGLYGASRRKRI